MIGQHRRRKVSGQHRRLEQAPKPSVLQASDGTGPRYIQSVFAIFPYAPHHTQRNILLPDKVLESRAIKPAQASSRDDPESAAVVDEQGGDGISGQTILLGKGTELAVCILGESVGSSDPQRPVWAGGEHVDRVGRQAALTFTKGNEF